MRWALINTVPILKIRELVDVERVISLRCHRVGDRAGSCMSLCTFNHRGAQWFSTGGQHIRITDASYTCTPLPALSPVAYASGSQLASHSNQVGSFQKYRVQGPTPDQPSQNRRVRLPRHMIKDGLAGVEKHWTGNDLELKFLPLSLICR